MVKENDIVLIHEDHIPQGKWKLAKVIKLISGQDGIVRGVKVQVGSSKAKISVIKRPIEKLNPLEIRTEGPIKQLKIGQDEHQTEIQSYRQRPRRAAAFDADWRWKTIDQSIDQWD